VSINARVPEELGFYSLRKVMRVLLDEWGMKPRLAFPGNLPKQALLGPFAEEVIRAHERKRRKIVNGRIEKEGKKKLKFCGVSESDDTGSKMSG